MNNIVAAIFFIQNVNQKLSHMPLIIITDVVKIRVCLI